MSEKKRFPVRLMRWSDSSANGRTVTLKLPDDAGEHPFKGLSVGAKNGQTMDMEIWLTDEPAADPKPKTKKAAPKPATRGTAVIGKLTRRVVTRTPRNTGDTDAELSYQNVRPNSRAAYEHSPISDKAAALPQLDSIAKSPVTENEIASYADKMGDAAEALAAVADRLGPDDTDDVDDPVHMEDAIDDDPSEVGPRAVRRAVDLCKAVDNQRAGFFYFMRTLHPNAPALPTGDGDWSRDSRATRDRVCFHCETVALEGLADDTDARKRFEALEHEFERAERFR